MDISEELRQGLDANDAADLARAESLMERAADEIDRLKERCEAYKGQVACGAKEIERLKAQCDSVDDLAERQSNEIRDLQALLDGRDHFIVSEGLWSKFVDQLPFNVNEQSSEKTYGEVLREMGGRGCGDFG